MFSKRFPAQLHCITSSAPEMLSLRIAPGCAQIGLFLTFMNGGFCLLFNQVLNKKLISPHTSCQQIENESNFALKIRHLFIPGEMPSFSVLPLLLSWKVKFYRNQTNSALIFRAFHNLTMQEWCFYEKMHVYISCIHSKSYSFSILLHPSSTSP